ncbi:hypothetical protein BU15DRAFT_67981 [Melanogaster broomeanus]|nr:hypothetical protein BU15DRAFT_67981 [Melanogaster broomeanus]
MAGVYLRVSTTYPYPYPRNTHTPLLICRRPFDSNGRHIWVKRMPPNLPPPPPSTTTLIPWLAIQTLLDGPWPGSARNVPSNLAENCVGNDDTPSSTFSTISHNRDGLGRIADHLGSVSQSLCGVCEKNLVDRVARRRATGRSSPWLEAWGALVTIPPGSTTLVLWKTTLPSWRTRTTSSCTIPAQYPLPPLLRHVGHTTTTTLHFDMASSHRPCYRHKLPVPNDKDLQTDYRSFPRPRRRVTRVTIHNATVTRLIHQHAAEKERNHEASKNVKPGTIKHVQFTFSLDHPSPIAANVAISKLTSPLDELLCNIDATEDNHLTLQQCQSDYKVLVESDVVMQETSQSSMLHTDSQTPHNNYDADLATPPLSQPVKDALPQTVALTKVGTRGNTPNGHLNLTVKTHNAPTTRSSGPGATATSVNPAVLRGTNSNSSRPSEGRVFQLRLALRASAPRWEMVDVMAQCYNCHTTATSPWRKDDEGKTICNALYHSYQLHGSARLNSMKSDVICKWLRHDARHAGLDSSKTPSASPGTSHRPSPTVKLPPTPAPDATSQPMYEYNEETTTQ